MKNQREKNMDMQDKEFDDIFRSKLDGFEAEPTGRVWEGIDEKLDTSSRRAIFMPILRIAAIIIVLITAGILFIPHGGKVKPAKPGNIVAKVTPSLTKKQDAVAPVKQPEPQKAVEQQVAVNQLAHVSIPKKEHGPVSISQPQIAVKEVSVYVKPIEQQTLAAIEPLKKAEITQPVVPGPETALTIKTIDNIAQPNATTQTIAHLPAINQAAKPTKRHGIHNFGDLVNIVVARVDKRKDKAIEFTDSDGDESAVTAVNIGPVKIKKDLDR